MWSSSSPTPLRTAPSGGRRLARLRRFSAWMALGCLATALLLALAMGGYWLTAPSGAVFAAAGLPGVPPLELSLGVRALAFALTMIPLGALIFGLLHARRCFADFAAGHIFGPDTIARLRVFALGVAASALLKPFAGAALSLLLSWHGGPGEKSLVLAVGSDTLIALLFAGTVAILAWVMGEAMALSDENQQFV